MASEKAPAAPFDLSKLQQVAELMEKHDLHEVKLERGDEKWQIRRGAPPLAMPGPGSFPMFAAQPQPSAAPTASAALDAAPAANAGEAGLTPIKSPTVGTFYQAAQPGDPPFVKVGDKVKSETIVCLIEAMKVFNQIPAKIHGTIAKVVLKDGDAVDFGQTLYWVKE